MSTFDPAVCVIIERTVRITKTNIFNLKKNSPMALIVLVNQYSGKDQFV